MGHGDIRTTQIYLHVMKKPGLGMRSPLDQAGTHRIQLIQSGRSLRHSWPIQVVDLPWSSSPALAESA